jgi:predicted CoA-binding protein
MTNEIRSILKDSKTIAVVGMSPNPERISHQIGLYLQKAGYNVIPVYPGVDKVAGIPAYSNLEEIPQPVDIVNVFRRSEFVMDVAQSAVDVKAKAIWMQEGVINHAASEYASNHGVEVIMDRCIMVDHQYI